METLFALLAFCAGNSPQRPVTRSVDVLFDLRLNKRLSKQSWGYQWLSVNKLPLRWNSMEPSMHYWRSLRGHRWLVTRSFGCILIITFNWSSVTCELWPRNSPSSPFFIKNIIQADNKWYIKHKGSVMRTASTYHDVIMSQTLSWMYSRLNSAIRLLYALIRRRIWHVSYF